MPCKPSDLNGKTDTPTECIDGLLGPVPTVRANNKPHKKGASEQPKAPIADGQLSAPLISGAEKDELTEPSQNINAGSDIPSKDSTSAALEESLFLPSCFSVHDSERTGYPFHVIEENPADLQQLEYFLQFNPILGIEIVTDADSGADMVLLSASNQFYYIPADSEQAVSIFRTYFSKSSIRRQICMDPYRVYSFLQKNDICCRNVYSLRRAYLVMSQAKGKSGIKKPTEMVRELVSKDNLYSHSLYIFAMLQYVRMYEVLSAHALMQAPPQINRLRTLSFLDMFLGISYELEAVSDETGFLFELDENLEFQFRYSPMVKIKDGISAVNFAFSSDKPVKQLVIELICSLSRKRLAQTYGFRMLRYSQDSLTIATPERHYAHLCDTVANLAAFLAEKLALAPLDVTEQK